MMKGEGIEGPGGLRLLQRFFVPTHPRQEPPVPVVGDRILGVELDCPTVLALGSPSIAAAPRGRLIFEAEVKQRWKRYHAAYH